VFDCAIYDDTEFENGHPYCFMTKKQAMKIPVYIKEAQLTIAYYEPV
jgi:hypothetical protein